jgi:amidase
MPDSMSAAQQAQAVRAGEVSARDLVEASLAEIEQRDGEIGAFVALCAERALAEADSVRPGDPRPLCGVPIALKDLLSASAGLPTTHGSHALGDWVADHDTHHVRRLRAAGAIVIGKTNSPELGLRPVTENARYGTTRNPWDLRLSAGGSSGGSAAAVAAGMVALAEGNDLGGSLRIPASCCGVVSLKPSRGRVSIGPDYSNVAMGAGVDGVLTRTVLDTAIALDAMAGYEPGDHHWLAPPAVPYAQTARMPDDVRVRVRVATEAPLGVPIDDDPRAAATRAADLLAELGHDVGERTPAWDDDGFAAAWSTFVTGTLQHLIRVLERLHGRPIDPDGLEPASRAWLLDAPRVELIDFLEAHEYLGAFSRRLLACWEPDAVLVTPTLTRLPAPAEALRAGAGVTDDALRFSVLVRIWNVTGQPAISLPLHAAADGIPVGVQLVAPPGREDLLIALGAQLEDSAGWMPRSATSQ